MAFGIGPFRLERTLSGWHWRHGGAIQGIGGFAMLLPSPTRGQSRIDSAWYILGGPLANLLLAALAIVMLRDGETASLARVFWFALALTGALFTALNLLPLTVGGWRNDGRCLLDLALGRADALLGQRLQALSALTRSGVRPRDWPPALVPAQLPEGIRDHG